MVHDKIAFCINRTVYFLDFLDHCINELIHWIFEFSFTRRILTSHFIVPLIYLWIVSYHATESYCEKVRMANLEEKEPIKPLTDNGKSELLISKIIKAKDGSNSLESTSTSTSTNIAEVIQCRPLVQSIRMRSSNGVTRRRSTTSSPYSTDGIDTLFFDASNCNKNRMMVAPLVSNGISSEESSSNEKTIKQPKKTDLNWIKWILNTRHSADLSNLTVSEKIFSVIKSTLNAGIYFIIGLCLQQYILVFIMNLHPSLSNPSNEFHSSFQYLIFSPEKCLSYLLANMICLPIYKFLSKNLFFVDDMIIKDLGSTNSKKKDSFHSKAGNRSWRYFSTITLYYSFNGVLFYFLRRAIRNICKIDNSLQFLLVTVGLIFFIRLMYQPFIQPWIGKQLERLIHDRLYSLSHQSYFPVLLISLVVVILSKSNWIISLWDFIKPDFQFTTAFYLAFLLFNPTFDYWPVVSSIDNGNENIVKGPSMYPLRLVLGETLFLSIIKLGELVSTQSPSALVVDLPYLLWSEYVPIYD